MAKKQEKEIERWVTVNGARVPIFKDGSIGGPKEIRELITGKKATKAKKNIDKPQNELTDKQKKTLAKKELKKHPNDSKTGLLKHQAGEAVKKEQSTKLSENPYTKKAMDDMGLAGKKWDKLTDSQKQYVAERASELEDRAAKRQAKKVDKKSSIEGRSTNDLVKNLKEKGYTIPDVGNKSQDLNKSKTVTLYNKDDKSYYEADVKVHKNPNGVNGYTISNIRKDTKSTKNETVEQAMDRLQKESRAKVDSMSAQQVMKYAKENGLRGLKTDTLAQRDDRVANHMYMQEMKKWREQKNVAENEALKEKQIAQNKAQKDERNNQVSDRVKSYQDKFLKKKSVAEIKEIQSNIEKSGRHLGYTDSDMVAMRAIENELKERNSKQEKKLGKGVVDFDLNKVDPKKAEAKRIKAELRAENDDYDRRHKEGKYAEKKSSKEDKVKKTFGTTAAEARKSLKEYDNIDLKEVALECGFDRNLVDHLTSQELRVAILAIYKRK